MDITKPSSKQESIASLLALTQKLEEKEVMRVTDITRGMVLAKLAKQSSDKEVKTCYNKYIEKGVFYERNHTK